MEVVLGFFHDDIVAVGERKSISHLGDMLGDCIRDIRQITPETGAISFGPEGQYSYKQCRYQRI
jgi:hypothetical protein